MLHKAEAFEPLTDEPWAEARVLARVRAIVANAGESFDPDELWPIDERDAEGAALPLTSLYSGASGIVWALDRLRPHAEVAIDLPAAAVRTLEAWREQPDYPERLDEPPVRGHASLFFGETGPLYVAWLLTRDAALADDLYARVRENAAAPANELMWASVGTMLVAGRMLERTDDERWAEAWRVTAEILWERRDDDGLWTTPPFGRGLGAAHGASTTANVLLQGGDLWSEERRTDLRRRTAEALARFAVVEEGLANWPMVAGDELVGFDGQIRVQWCHGAPGVVSSAASYLEEELLVAGAEL